MSNPNWNEIAAKLIYEEEKAMAQMDSPTTAAVLEWRKESYIAIVQQIVIEYHSIVLLSKWQRPLLPKLQEAILELQPRRRIVQADPLLNLESRLHILFLVRNNLKNIPLEYLPVVEKYSLKVQLPKNPRED